MTCVNVENEKSVETVLKEAGFTVSQRCCCRPSCFDFAARKNRTLVFIKIQPDIGNVSPSDPLELTVMSEHVSASSLLISEKVREKPLEDDTVYSRYNVLAVTRKTFENIMLRKIYPLIQAGPGGYYVEIDAEAIKRRRQDLGLSIGELAQMMGTSRRTVYGYERGLAKASVSAAYSLICILGIPVGQPKNPLQRPKNQPKRFLTTAKRAITKSKLLQKILRKLARYNVATFKKAPFDFIINVQEGKMKIIGGVANNNERELDRRVNEILSVSRVVQAHPILITEGQKPPNKDILCIHCEELSKIRDPEDLIANFK
jgi:putative transcriptional regulator